MNIECNNKNYTVELASTRFEWGVVQYIFKRALDVELILNLV